MTISTIFASLPDTDMNTVTLTHISMIPGGNLLMALIFPNIRMAHQIECRAIFMDVLLSAKKPHGQVSADGAWECTRMGEYFDRPYIKYNQEIRNSLMAGQSYST